MTRGKFDGVDTIPMDIYINDHGSDSGGDDPIGKGFGSLFRVRCPSGNGHVARVVQLGRHLVYATHYYQTESGHTYLCLATGRDTAELPHPRSINGMRGRPDVICTTCTNAPKETNTHE